VGDSALSFITAKCTQGPPYTFKTLRGRKFSEARKGTIEVDHFSSFGISSQQHDSISDYAICIYYKVTKEFRNIYEAYITITPNHELYLEWVSSKYAGDEYEEGPSVTACIKQEIISLDHESAWKKDGWELTLLVPPTLQKKVIDDYHRGKVIPNFSIRLELKHSLNPKSLVQPIRFTGIEPSPFFLTISREPASKDLQSQTTSTSCLGQLSTPLYSFTMTLYRC
jgi:hypothetical protein